MNSSPSYLGTSEWVVHFGLGAAPVIDTLRVHWPRGYATTMSNVAVNQHLSVAAPTRSDMNADGTTDPADLAFLLGSWGP